MKKYFGVIIAFLMAFYLHTPVKANFVEKSVLNSGSWYRIKVSSTGVYRISYEDLKAIGFETPENIRIYGNGGGQLPYLNQAEVTDDLAEVALYANLGGDSQFGPGDYYLFYAEGTLQWEYNLSYKMFVQKQHIYAENNYYFITSSFGPGKRISEVDNPSISPNVIVNSYDIYAHHELESSNLIGTGRLRFGENFREFPFEKSFNLNAPLSNQPIKLLTSVALRSSIPKSVDVKFNSTSLEQMSFRSSNTTNSEAIYADHKKKLYAINASDAEVKIKLSLLNGVISDEVYLDFITLNARSSLIINTPEFFFRDISSVGAGQAAKFEISGANSSTQIWNVNDHNQVYRLKTNLSGGQISFVDSVSTLKKYLAVDVNSNFRTPVLSSEGNEDVGWIENQNLHALPTPELLIVTHPLFIEQANELAELHRDKDLMRVVVATTEQIYNEFSSGKKDVCAIRNFARMFYERSTPSVPFKYLLLFGDGTYDNRTSDPNNPNYIPTYQSPESMSPTASYTSDDMFAMMEPGEWDESGDLDIGVGRIPVKSTENQQEAQGVVDKIKLYYEPKVMKDWRNRLIFLGDDGESGWDNEIFMADSDSLTRIVEKYEPTMNITKIYLDAYPQISSSTGAAYPEVEIALANAFNRGALVFNYMGHGGENGITQERVFQKTDIEGLKNSPNFPLFITATCQVSRFDNVVIDETGEFANKLSAGEAALINPNGGAIALLTTTRLVYQDSNFRLSKNVYNQLFKKDENGKRYRLGDIMRIAKNNTSGTTNKLKFSLLGDPALTLAYGEFKVLTDSINSQDVSVEMDTISAFEKVRISGHIADNNSTLIDDFNGVVYVNAFDKKYTASTRSNDGIPIINFSMQDKMLFRGKAKVVNGLFTVEFKIPKDISYSFGKGKMSYYATNDIIDAKGYFDGFIIGGTSNEIIDDFDGPEISLFMNNEGFKPGGLTNSNPVLLAKVSDENGINTTGSGIGHDISGVLDDEQTNRFVLNDYFEGELDDYRRGSIRYPLSDLEDGRHEFYIKVWDIYNNSNDARIDFYVQGASGIILEKIMNYPNPASTFTNFQYSHNMPGKHEVFLQVFDLSGRVVYSFDNESEEQGFVSQPIAWDIGSASGNKLTPGVYTYRLQVMVKSGQDTFEKSDFQSGRLIIIP